MFTLVAFNMFLSIKILNSVPHYRAQILLAIFGTVYALHFALAR